MKQRIIALLTTGLLILSLAGCAAQNTTAQTLPESVTAGGSGKATAAADIAQLTLGVETEGATTEAAREKNAEAVQAAVDFLTGMGVAESDIKTERIYLGEQYDGGYQMSTRMTVLVREIDRAGEAIDGVVNAGVNSIYDVEYGVADEAALYEQALENAAADAKESAQKMAEAAGRTLGDVISVEESSYGGATLVRQQAEDGSFTDATLSAPGDLRCHSGSPCDLRAEVDPRYSSCKWKNPRHSKVSAGAFQMRAVCPVLRPLAAVRWKQAGR